MALSDLRRRLRRRAYEGRLLRRVHVERVPAPEVDPELWAAVAARPPRQREAIVQCYVGDLTEREVATVLGISEGAASNAPTTAPPSRSPATGRDQPWWSPSTPETGTATTVDHLDRSARLIAAA